VLFPIVAWKSSAMFLISVFFYVVGFRSDPFVVTAVVNANEYAQQIFRFDSSAKTSTVNPRWDESFLVQYFWGLLLCLQFIVLCSCFLII
jgi:hypothetical protein